jgi:all-trans-retinol 13,14-reductase
MGTSSFDAVVIGSGLGGLTAGALLAKAGYSVCLLERNHSLGGSASCYKIGSLIIEASLHETANPSDPRDPKHNVLKTLGLLDKIEWLPVGDLYTVQGGSVGEPFTLPHGFGEARQALTKRFPRSETSLAHVLGKVEEIYKAVGDLSAARDNRSLAGLMAALRGCYPLLSGWRASLDGIFAEAFGDNEALKLALAANLPYYAADPERLWWLFYAVAQGGYIGAGGVYVKGGSRQLSIKLAGTIKRAGGTVLLGTQAAGIELTASGEVAAVMTATRGDKVAQRLETRIVLANCAPNAIAGMLAEKAKAGFEAAFSGMAPSTSLFSAHFGLTCNPAQFGLRGYSTVLLPDWMTTLAYYKRAAPILNGNPDGRLPPLVIVNYGAIEAGLEDGGPLLVTVAGLDDVSKWQSLTQAEEAARRNAWLDAILGELERHYPGFAGAVAEKVLVNAASMQRYLGTPNGAVYGFDPLPPSRPIWGGMPRSPRTPVAGIYLASSFGGSGGYSGAMGSGADAAHLAKCALGPSRRA